MGKNPNICKIMAVSFLSFEGKILLDKFGNISQQKSLPGTETNSIKEDQTLEYENLKYFVSQQVVEKNHVFPCQKKGKKVASDKQIVREICCPQYQNLI